MVMLRTRKRLRNPAASVPRNPMAMHTSDNASGATFEPGIVVATLMFGVTTKALRCRTLQQHVLRLQLQAAAIKKAPDRERRPVRGIS